MIIIYIIISLINVFLHIVRSILVIKSGKFIASLANCICYTFSAVVIKFIAEVDLWIAIAVALIFVATGKDILYTADMFVTDHLYAHYDGPEQNIVVIGIDEETLSKYGNLTLWSREKTADLINKLYETLCGSAINN